MIAQTLNDAIRVFNPKQALTGPLLHEYFVKREHEPLTNLRTTLTEDTATPAKIIFTGHRGSGKTTELARLAELVNGDFFVVSYATEGNLDLWSLDYIELLEALAGAIYQTARERGVKLDSALITEIYEWLVKVTQEVQVEVGAGAEAEAALNFYFVKLGSKLRSEGTSRETLKRELEPRVSDLLEKIDKLLTEVQSKVHKPLLVIIDGLDKPQLEVARRLFVDHAEALVSPKCKIIFSFPLSLLYSIEFAQLRQAFDYHFVLPNVSIFDHDGTRNQRGYLILRELVTKRMSLDLIKKDALDLLISMSGGIPRELVRLIQSSSVESLANGRTSISKTFAQKAVNELRNVYRRSLRPSHYQELHDIRRRRGVPAVKDVHLELLHNLSLLEFRNDSSWFAVNPILEALIDEMNLLEE